jgi:phosphatidylinositol alpha-1,6-mannosyltransferase
LKYLVISSEFPPGPGGIGQHAASFVQALCKKGDVHVLANQDYTTPKEIKGFKTQLPANVRFTSFAMRKGKTTSFIRIAQAVKMVNEIQPKVVFVSGRFPLWIGAILKFRFPKMRVVGFVHGTEITLTGSTLSAITKKAYQRLDRIIAVSKFTRSLLHPSVQQKKVIVVPNGLDDSFLKESKELAIIPLKWEGDPIILTVGNVTPRKGQHRVINALPNILRTFPNAHYHIVGLPTDAQVILEQAKKAGVEGALTIHGRLPSRQELYRAYSTADLFMMLSENQKNGDLEGFGIAILEANAFKLPAIGAIGCGIEDAISEESGKLVDGNDSAQIVEAMTHILDQKETYAKSSRSWAEQHNWDNLISKIDL